MPSGKKVIGTKWVYKVKCKPDVTVERYNIGLVAKVMLKRRAFILMRPFAPTCHMTTFHSICALAAHHDWHIHHLDIKTAFLNGYLHEEVYGF